MYWERISKGFYNLVDSKDILHPVASIIKISNGIYAAYRGSFGSKKWLGTFPTLKGAKSYIHTCL